MGGWVGGETKIKAKLSPAEAGAWAELGKNGHSLSQLVLSIPKTFAECLERDKKKFPTEYPNLPSPVSGWIARSRSHSLPLVTVPTHSRLIRNRTRIG